MSWFEALWFFLPAGFSNMIPVLVSRAPALKNWKTPLDMGRKFRGIRILGDNKTVRGLVCGTLGASLLAVLQSTIIEVDSAMYTIALVGAAMGFGALFGDFLESFFKRQRHIASGERWFPFDQIDYIIGGLLFVAPFADITVVSALKIFILYFGLHLITAYIGYKLGLKDKPI